MDNFEQMTDDVYEWFLQHVCLFVVTVTVVYPIDVWINSFNMFVCLFVCSDGGSSRDAVTLPLMY